MTPIADAINELVKALKYLSRRVHNLEVSPKLTDTGMLNYENDSTLVGWSPPLTYFKISYNKVCSLVFVSFVIVGDSNNANSSFTLPYACSSIGPVMTGPMGAEDNGIPIYGAIYHMLPGQSLVNLYTSMAGAGWTDHGSKDARGQFFYWAES